MTVGTPTYPNSTRDSGSTYKGRIDDALGVQRRIGGAFAPSASVQFDFIPGDVSTTDDTIARADHNLFASDKGRFTTTGVLPAPLALATDYFVLASGLTAGVLKVSLSDGGAAVNITDTGSGIHTFTRTANLKVAIAKGFIWDGTTLTEVAAQQTAALVAPVTNPRIDRLVISDSTGALSVITGAEAESGASAPALTADKIPVCQIAWTVGQTQIVNADITDERVPPVPVVDALPLTGGTMTGDITMSAASIFDANASLAAHATTAAIWSLGNYVTLTGGATTFTDFADAPQAGAEVELYCNAAHVFTDNANLEVDGDANFTAEAGDRVLVRAKSTSVFTVHPRKKTGAAVGGGNVVKQVVTLVTGAVAVTNPATVMIIDDTKPQNTEGDQYMELAITPTSATNKLVIEVVANAAFNVAGFGGAALFQDAVADALASIFEAPTGTNNIWQFAFNHVMTAGGTSAITFKVRIGPVSAGITTFNGQSGARLLGGVCASSIIISEVEP